MWASPAESIKQADCTNQSKTTGAAGLWRRSSGCASPHWARRPSEPRPRGRGAWRVLMSGRKVNSCLGRSGRQRCGAFLLRPREWRTCWTCRVGCGWTACFFLWWTSRGVLLQTPFGPVAPGPALPPGAHLHRRTRREKAAAGSVSIWTGTLCQRSCSPGHSCTRG